MRACVAVWVYGRCGRMVSCVGVGVYVGDRVWLVSCVREDCCGRTVGVAGFRSWEAGRVPVGVGCVVLSVPVRLRTVCNRAPCHRGRMTATAYCMAGHRCGPVRWGGVDLSTSPCRVAGVVGWWSAGCACGGGWRLAGWLGCVGGWLGRARMVGLFFFFFRVVFRVCGGGSGVVGVSVSVPARRLWCFGVAGWRVRSCPVRPGGSSRCSGYLARWRRPVGLW